MKVILPGSYDPITLGHLDIIKRAREKYDEVFVVAFINPDKKYCFSEQERLDMLSLATLGMDNVNVDFFCGRVVDYMKEKGIEKVKVVFSDELPLAPQTPFTDGKKSVGSVVFVPSVAGMMMAAEVVKDLVGEIK